MHDAEKPATGRVEVVLEQVYRAKDRIYIRYSVANETKAPFRVTTPDVCAPVPTEHPISLVSLRNHQIVSVSDLQDLQSETGFRHRCDAGQSGTRDLAPGEKTMGVISIGTSTDNPPQVYQLNFGADQNGPLKVEAVL